MESQRGEVGDQVRSPTTEGHAPGRVEERGQGRADSARAMSSSSESAQRAQLEEENAILRAERDRARAALRAAARALPVAIWVAHDRNCDVVTGNDEAHRQYRVPAAHTLTHAGSELVPSDVNLSPFGNATKGWVRFLHEGVEISKEGYPITRAAHDGEEVRGFVMDMEFKDGRRSTISIDAVPILDESQQPIGAVAASLDITEIRERERLMEESAERFKALVKASRATLCITDAELRIVHPLPGWEEFTRQDYESYRGYGWERAIHPEDMPLVTEAVREAVTQHVSYCARYRLWKGDPDLPFSPGVPGAGEWRHVEDTSAPLLGPDGGLLEWAGWVVDRTDQHNAEQSLADHARALARSNQDLEEFAHIAAHDLKEPLRGLRLIASFVEEDAGPALDEQNLQRLGTLQDLCGRMQLLMDSLLESARVTAQPLREEATTLAEPLKEAMALLSGRVEQERAEVTVDEGAGATCVRCDKERIAQVLANLIANGLKYNNSAEKHVRIGVRAGLEHEVVVFVKDNGIGMSEEQVKLIFRMFRRLHGRDSYGGGAGAGLAIARKIVERHGGRMWVESEPGKGSTFLFTLSKW